MSWASLSVCIAATLVSFLVAKKAYKKDVLILDAEYSKEKVPEVRKQSEELKSRIEKLNWLSLTAFVVGLIMLGVFAGYNLWQKTQEVSTHDLSRRQTKTTTAETFAPEATTAEDTTAPDKKGDDGVPLPPPPRPRKGL